MTQKNLILAIDQGTTSTRAVVFSLGGQVLGTGQYEVPQYYPHSGWVEHNPEELWGTTLKACHTAIEQANIPSARLASIGITNQRETVIAWQKSTGQSIHPAIVWQDRRTAQQCNDLKKAGYESVLKTKTGLLLDPYFSATKIQWLFEHIPEMAALAEKNDLCVGTVDSFLLWKLTEGNAFKTDMTNASRTALLNIHTLSWDDELLELFDIPPHILPEVCDNADDFGVTGNPWFDGNRIPISAMAGDQHAAMIGQACFQAGAAKSTYGTGCFLMMNTGEFPLTSHHQLLTTIAYKIGDELAYALEGSIFMAGATVQWFRDELHWIKDAKECEQLATQVGYENPVVMVPAFTGLGAPHWEPNARGALFGLSRDTGIAHIVTAGLQSVCYQTLDLIKSMSEDGMTLSRLKVDGGMVENDWFLQCLSDILQVPIDKPKHAETTIWGVFQLAALQSGLLGKSSISAIQQQWQISHRFSPKLQSPDQERYVNRWQKAVSATIQLAKD